MKLLYFCLFIFVLLLFGGCDTASAPVAVSNRSAPINSLPQGNLPMPGKPIGEMNWALFEGGQQKIGEYKGKVVVLDFWATYCPPCIKEIPHLNELQAKYGAENLQIIGLHVGGEEDRGAIPDFVKKTPIKYPLATPEEALVQFIFGGESAIPQTAIFDRAGNLIQKFIGYDDKIKAEMDAIIEKAVNGK